MDIHQTITEFQLTPFSVLLRQTLEQLQQRDVLGIFAEPVSAEEVNTANCLNYQTATYFVIIIVTYLNIILTNRINFN